MTAFSVGMKLYWNPNILQGCVICQRVPNAVYLVVFILEQKRRRRLSGNVSCNIGIQFKGACPHGKMAGVDGDSKIRTATLSIRGINFGIQAMIEMDTRHWLQVAAEDAGTPILWGSICHSAA